MKKLFLIISMYASVIGIVSAQSNYYWYQGKKIPVTENPKKKYVLFNEGKADVNKAAGAAGATVKAIDSERIPGTLRKYKGKQLAARTTAILESGKAISDLKQENVYYKASFYKNAKGQEAALTNRFYVKLKQSGDLPLLEKMAATYHAEILGNNVFMPLWYTLSATPASEGDALQLANTFYESGLFAAAEGEFLFEIKHNCANDTYFNNQWGFNNTGQGPGISGYDANVCEAWQLTQGSSDVVVAVVDEGVELNHPDLVNNVYPVSYDAHTGTSPSVVRGSHGTSCAGIIAATANNSAGVAGVAPNCKIMSVSIMFGGGGSSPSQFADAINFAWQNGAAVISNSWYYETWETQVMDDAIENAMNNGRGGKGTVVVFAAGNTDGAITNPADNNPRTLVVGAMSPCGQRKSPSSCDGETWWGSSYGTQLDITAPGVLIPTTTINASYNNYFNGTSSAAPHAAGVAALILSMNPDLTIGQVTDIIEQSAQKVGSYTYSTTTDRANGLWNNEMGYGLLDARGALEMISSTGTLLTRFNVPRTSAIPAGYRQYSHVHKLGIGGPDLSNVFNSVFNWQGSTSQPNSLYQFTLETTNGIPRYYTNIVDYATYMLHQASPEITINSAIGFSGLAGSYWVNLDGSNLVLVEKSGNYALYFSNSSTPPTARTADLAAGTSATDGMVQPAAIAPNPFTSATSLTVTPDMGTTQVVVTNLQGQVVDTWKGEGDVTFGHDYQPGIYHVKVVSAAGVKFTTLIKQ